MSNISNLNYEDLRATTIAAHESPALFEMVAEISGVAENEENIDYTDQTGSPVNAFGSPLSLWEMKSGLFKSEPPKKRSLWSRIKWGVCQDAIEDLGLQGRKAEAVYISSECEHMSSRVDMEVADGDEDWQPMIAKNIASRTVDMWKNAVGDWVVPESVQIEAQHHMIVRGSKKCYIACLFSGVMTKTFIVERDNELGQEILEAISDFWNLVNNKNRPRPNTERDQYVLSRLNANIAPKEEVIDLRNNNEIIDLISQKEKLKANEKLIKKELSKIDAQLKEKMDGVGSAIISDTHQIRWIKLPEKEMSFTRKASAYLRTSKINPKAAGSDLESLIED